MDLLGEVGKYHLLAVGGIIKPPPAMVMACSDFIVGSLASVIMRKFQFDCEALEYNGKPSIQLETDRDKIVAQSIKSSLQQYAGRRNHYGIKALGPNNAFIPFDFVGWACPYGDTQMTKAMLEAGDINGINVDLRFAYERSKNKAEWFAENWLIRIYLMLPKGESLDDYRGVVRNFPIMVTDIKDTVEHELIHMVQNIGMQVKDVKRKKNLTGIPPRNVRSPDYAPGGFQREDVKEKGTRRMHELRDVEFYTNLNDALKEYRRLLRFIPDELQDETLRVFVGAQDDVANSEPYPIDIGANSFFKALKRYDLKRWELAVKRFVVALNQ